MDKPRNAGSTHFYNPKTKDRWTVFIEHKWEKKDFKQPEHDWQEEIARTA